MGFEGQTIPELFLTLSTPFPFHAAIPQLTNIASISDPEEWFVLLRTASLWRVLLPTDPDELEAAGDAAHLSDLLAGMGMNGDIHDALNLAEKLAALWRGAPLDTMGRYERQRRKVAREVVQQQALRNRVLLNQKNPTVRRLFLDELRATAADPARHRVHLLRSSMTQSLIDLQRVA